jgi:hypothetical protein
MPGKEYQPPRCENVVADLYRNITCPHNEGIAIVIIVRRINNLFFMNMMLGYFTKIDSFA